MNLLYIIFSALLTSQPIIPSTPDAANTPSKKSLENVFLIRLNENPPAENSPYKLQGYDGRFPSEKNGEEKYRMSLLLHSFDQLRTLEHSTIVNLEDADYTPIIRDVLSLHEINPAKRHSGGLFDDWERNIF